MLFEHFGVQIYHVPWLLAKANNINATCKCLQIGIRSYCFSERVHHVKSRFIAIKEQALETSPASCFKILHPRIYCRFQCGQEIFGCYPCSKHRLKSVTEGCVHKFNFFLGHDVFPMNFFYIMRKNWL